MIDVHETLARGGAERVALLRYCAMSMNMEPVFLFAAGEYRLRPTPLLALELFDVFCAVGAPARLAAHELLPPRELALSSEIARIRERWLAIQAPVEAETEDAEQTRSGPAGPSRTLFDALARGVRADAHGRIAAIARSYDPLQTPQENLPGGAMSPGQRQFMDTVWLPIVRPRLKSAGLWQLASIG